MRYLAAAGWLLLAVGVIVGFLWLVSRVDDWLNLRQQARAAARLARAQQDVVAEAEHYTRTAAARTEEGTP